jgi:ribosome-binding factor A
MGLRKHPRKEMLSLTDALGPEDGSDPRDFFRKREGKVENRKALQLCDQVARTLTGVLVSCADAVLRDLAVVAVQLAPNSSRLLVTLSFAPGAETVEPSQVLQHLQRAHGLLRSAVATGIHRRRVPELVFRLHLPSER